MTLKEINPQVGQMIACLNETYGWWQYGEIIEIKYNHTQPVITVQSKCSDCYMASGNSSTWYDDDPDNKTSFYTTFDDLKVKLL